MIAAKRGESNDERFTKHRDKSKPRIIITTLGEHVLDARY